MQSIDGGVGERFIHEIKTKRSRSRWDCVWIIVIWALTGARNAV